MQEDDEEMKITSKDAAGRFVNSFIRPFVLGGASFWCLTDKLQRIRKPLINDVLLTAHLSWSN